MEHSRGTASHRHGRRRAARQTEADAARPRANAEPEMIEVWRPGRPEGRRRPRGEQSPRASRRARSEACPRARERGANRQRRKRHAFGGGCRGRRAARLPNKPPRPRAGLIVEIAGGTALNSSAPSGPSATNGRAPARRGTTATARNGANRARKRRTRIRHLPSWRRSRRSSNPTPRSAADGAGIRGGPAD